MPPGPMALAYRSLVDAQAPQNIAEGVRRDDTGPASVEGRMRMKRNEVVVYDVFCGIDVGKTSNYFAALRQDDEKPFFKAPVAQDEAEIREALSRVAEEGRTLVIVDQFGAFGRLAVAVAQDMGLDVAHMPPRKFKQVAETYGEDKSDSLDAFILADAARSAPRTIELVEERAAAVTEIKVITSCRDDAVRERTRCYNRLHDLIHQVCPALEAVFSKKKLHNDLEIRLIAHYGGPGGFRNAGKSRARKWAGGLKYHRVDGPEKVEEVFRALSRQTVELPGAAVIERQIKAIAERVIDLEAAEKALNAELERLADHVPEVAILESMDGIGKVFGATIAAEIGDIGRFESASRLASYGGVAPAKEDSGTTVHKKKKRKGGNRRLKNALIQSAVRAIAKDGSWERAYYDKKITEGKKHRQAIRALARRRVEVIYALLANGTFYEPLSAEG